MECSICISNIKNSVKTECGHEFCKECLDKWAKEQTEKELDTTCPLCRKVIKKFEKNQDIEIKFFMLNYQISMSYLNDDDSEDEADNSDDSEDEGDEIEYEDLDSVYVVRGDRRFNTISMRWEDNEDDQ